MKTIRSTQIALAPDDDNRDDNGESPDPRYYRLQQMLLEGKVVDMAEIEPRWTGHGHAIILDLADSKTVERRYIGPMAVWLEPKGWFGAANGYKTDVYVGFLAKPDDLGEVVTKLQLMDDSFLRDNDPYFYRFEE